MTSGHTEGRFGTGSRLTSQPQCRLIDFCDVIKFIRMDVESKFGIFPRTWRRFKTAF